MKADYYTLLTTIFCHVIWNHKKATNTHLEFHHWVLTEFVSSCGSDLIYPDELGLVANTIPLKTLYQSCFTAVLPWRKTKERKIDEAYSHLMNFAYLQHISSSLYPLSSQNAITFPTISTIWTLQLTKIQSDILITCIYPSPHPHI